MLKALHLRGLKDKPTSTVGATMTGRPQATLKMPPPRKPSFVDEVIQDLKAAPPPPVQALKEDKPKKTSKKKAIKNHTPGKRTDASFRASRKELDPESAVKKPRKGSRAAASVGHEMPVQHVASWGADPQAWSAACALGLPGEAGPQTAMDGRTNYTLYGWDSTAKIEVQLKNKCFYIKKYATQEL